VYFMPQDLELSTRSLSPPSDRWLVLRGRVANNKGLNCRPERHVESSCRWDGHSVVAILYKKS